MKTKFLLMLLLSVFTASAQMKISQYPRTNAFNPGALILLATTNGTPTNMSMTLSNLFRAGGQQFYGGITTYGDIIGSGEPAISGIGNISMIDLTAQHIDGSSGWFQATNATTVVPLRVKGLVGMGTNHIFEVIGTNGALAFAVNEQGQVTGLTVSGPQTNTSTLRISGTGAGFALVTLTNSDTGNSVMFGVGEETPESANIPIGSLFSSTGALYVKHGNGVTDWGRILYIDGGADSGTTKLGESAEPYHPTIVYGPLRVEPGAQNGIMVNYNIMEVKGTNGTVLLSVTSNKTVSVNARFVVPPHSTVQTVAAGTSLTNAASTIKVAGSGGAVSLTSEPNILTNNVADGEILRIVGTHDTNTLTVQDTSGVGGSACELGNATRALGNNDVLTLMWNQTSGKWIEIGFNNN